jgi:hypothetical protein
MATQTHISAACHISSQTVSKNGGDLFTGTATDVQSFLVEAYKHFELSYTRFYKMDNLSKLGWLASEVLLKGDFDKSKYKSEEIGIVLMNANSSLDSDQRYMASVADIPSPALFVYTLPNIVIGEICIRNNFKGDAAFFVSDKFDANFIEQYVNTLVYNQVLKACICGWVDVIGNEYKAVLFLVEQGEAVTPFTAQNMDKVFK